MPLQKGRGVWEQEEGTRFIRVDLDVFSRRRLTALATAFGDRVFLLHEERHGSRYILRCEARGWNLTIDQEIRVLIALIKKLPRHLRRIWNDAQSRQFNVGIQAGLQPRYREFKLLPRTIALVAEVRATIVITVYAPEVPSPRLKPRKRPR